MLYLLAALAVFGHWAICIFVINRLHSTALPYRMMKLIDLIWYGFLFAVPIGVFSLLIVNPHYRWLANHLTLRGIGSLYVAGCWSAVPVAIVVWVRHLTDAHITERLESNHTTMVDAARQLSARPNGSVTTAVLSRLPGNQVFQIAVQVKSLRLPRLDPQLDGLTITHLSDLHFTGRIARPFFELIVDRANELGSDMTVISGDIIDKPKCWDWLVEVLGKLHSPHGVYYVLGNHDLRLRDEMRVRRELRRAGMTDLGGRHVVVTVRERGILLAGNELPWFAPAADLRQTPLQHEGHRLLRVLVSHSPDQFTWARNHDVDLMLAGHTHGGQIRFPLIGPVFSPSRHGVKYASGTFFRAPTLMHVSRGLSGTRPLRFNCPPELAQLVLRGDSGHSSQGLP